jgi:hypothetical protein
VRNIPSQPQVKVRVGGARVVAMREKINAGGHASPYRSRSNCPSPVFGQIKQARGFRQFLLRGVEKVAAEWGPSLSRSQYPEARSRADSTANLEDRQKRPPALRIPSGQD